MENLQSFWYLCYQNTELCLLTCASLCLHVLQASNQMYYSYTMPCSLDALQTEWVCSCLLHVYSGQKGKRTLPQILQIYRYANYSIHGKGFFSVVLIPQHLRFWLHLYRNIS